MQLVNRSRAVEKMQKIFESAAAEGRPLQFPPRENLGFAVPDTAARSFFKELRFDAVASLRSFACLVQQQGVVLETIFPRKLDDLRTAIIFAVFKGLFFQSQRQAEWTGFGRGERMFGARCLTCSFAPKNRRNWQVQRHYLGEKLP